MKSSLWIKIGLGVAAFVAIVAASIVAIIAFFPKDIAVREIERQVEASTQRKLAINGAFSFTLFPTLGFSAEDVTLANPEGFGDAPFLSAKRVVFAVALMPLLQRDVQIKQLHLDEPVLALIAHADGKVNWEFPVSEDQPDLPSLKLEDMRVADGKLTLQGPEGPPLVIDQIDAALAVKSLDDPVEADGSLRYLNEPIRVHATIGDPRAVLTQGPSPLVATFNGAHVQGDFNGHFESATGRLVGALNAHGASVRRVMAWLGSPMGPGPGFAAYDVRGQFDFLGDTMKLTRGTYRVDAINATGDLTIITHGVRMTVNGALNAPNVDVNPYLPAPTQTGASPNGGVDVDTAWSAAPIDLTGLRGMDANLDVRIGALKFQRMSFTNARLLLGLNNGVADARLTQVSLYGGGGSARLVADARNRAARIATELSVDNIQAEPLLTDAIGFDRLSGHGRLTFSLLGQGVSQAEIARSLRGQASFRFLNGAYKGVNLAAVARQIQAALQGATVGPSAQTDFAEMSASFAIADGNAVTQDIALLNPYVRLDGRGFINIGAQTLDLRLSPRAVNSIQGQGGQANIQGLGVPFRVSGPWTHLQYRVDLEDTLRSQVQTQAQRALSRSNLGDLGALFGLRPQEAAAPSSAATPAAPSSAATPADTGATAAPNPAERAKTPEERAREALGGLFNRH